MKVIIDSAHEYPELEVNDSETGDWCECPHCRERYSLIYPEATTREVWVYAILETAIRIVFAAAAMALGLWGFLKLISL